MKRIVLILIAGILLIAVNLFAGDGDLIVDGKIGVGTLNPGAQLHIVSDSPSAEPAIVIEDTVTSGYTVSPLKFQLTSNSQVTPALEMCGMSGCGSFAYDSDNWRFVFNKVISAASGSLAEGGGISFGSFQQGMYSPVGQELVIYARGKLTLDTGMGSETGNIIITDSNVGIGTTNPVYPLQMGGGAYTDGLDWYPVSNREYKDNINDLPADKALQALRELNPVTFNYKANPEDPRVGFIAEDVPELVATKDRKGLSPMDIVAVLTSVVKEQQTLVEKQQNTITALTRRINEVEKEIKLKGSLAMAESGDN